MGDDIDLKKEGKKLIGVLVGVGLATGVAMLLTYFVNYGLSYAQNSTLTGAKTTMGQA